MTEAGSTTKKQGRSFVFLRLIRHVLGVVVLSFVVVVGYLWSLRPQPAGMVRLEELPGPVLVARDRLGVPCVAAETEESAFFALGYVHAQDRLWQMELLRRAAWGELTSLLGPSCHAVDLWHRRIGFYRQAMEIRSQLPKRIEVILGAYANGITAYLRAHPFRLPPEFLLSRLRPNLWKVEDVLAIGAMTQWLAVPCSERVPPQLTSGVLTVGNDSLTLESTPDGLSLFLSDLQVRMVADGQTAECELAWGQNIPEPWHEAGLRIAGDSMWRGWTIPGWPVPHVSCSRHSIRALVTDGPVITPWKNEVPVVQWTPVLEFLDESPTTGYCDTVLVSSGLSLIEGTGTGAKPLVLTGIPGWQAGALTAMFALWRDEFHGQESQFTGGPYTYNRIPGEEMHKGRHGRRDGRLHGRIELKPLIKFGLLDFFFPTERSAVTKLVASCDGRSWLPATSPVAVHIKWAGQQLHAAVAGGVSGVAGSRWRMNQMSSWEHGEYLERGEFIPIHGDCCMLVPLES